MRNKHVKNEELLLRTHHFLQSLSYFKTKERTASLPGSGDLGRCGGETCESVPCPPRPQALAAVAEGGARHSTGSVNAAPGLRGPSSACTQLAPANASTSGGPAPGRDRAGAVSRLWSPANPTLPLSAPFSFSECRAGTAAVSTSDRPVPGAKENGHSAWKTLWRLPSRVGKPGARARLATDSFSPEQTRVLATRACAR